jgi:CheY-like chemotaxis protein
VLDNALTLAANELRHRARVVKALTTVPAVRGNEARLTQVLVNLLINAAQAMPEGEADRHAITISSSVDGSGRVCLEVRDEGCGIAPEVLPRIFDPFFTTKPIGDGTGLGLSIAHRLISAMGGAIEVRSEPGCGSTFSVLLQPATREEPAPAPPVPAAKKRARVVILDDEPMVGTAVKRMLAREHDVTLLTEPQELFSLLARESIDVLLCDLMMPLMTGMDVFVEVQARFPSLAPRVVFLTGGAFTSRAKSFLAEVPNPRLEKPFDASKLRALIRTLTD